MRRIPFTAGWQTRPHAKFFAEMVGAAAPWQPVTLPHDATLGQPRNAAHGAGSGYFPGGCTNTGRRSPSRPTPPTSGGCWSSRASTGGRWST